jgi:hypothetical protein
MPKTTLVDYHKLYDKFVSILERRLGPKEDAVIHAIIGFEFGGPPDVLLFKHIRDISGTFYVTSDLLFSEHQPKNSLGRYEVAICLPEERQWAEHILFKLSQATLVETFDVGHTVDITAWVEDGCVIKGLLLTKLVSFRFSGQQFGALLCIGITRAELDYALEYGSQKLLSLLESEMKFPCTDLSRPSVV